MAVGYRRHSDPERYFRLRICFSIPQFTAEGPVPCGVFRLCERE